jgi:5'-nucleotidase / UDP-sugar diphosphatase
MKLFRSQSLGVALLAVAVALLLAPTAVWTKEYKLTIVHTNDHHGHFMKFGNAVGGLAAQSTIVNVIRAEVMGAKDAPGFVMVLSAGDINTGVPESDLMEAEPDIQLMNMIGYDAMALGNHEFDNPRKVLMDQMGWAEFPFISANVVRAETGEPLVEPYIIKEYDGLKVAILGLITAQTPILVMAGNVADLIFKNPIDVAKEYVPKLKAEADLVVVLSHLGFYQEGSGQIGDIELAKAVPEIDVIVGGHSHTKLATPEIVGNTIIVQTGGYSEQVGRLDLVVDSEANKVVSHAGKLISVNGKKSLTFKEKTYLVYAEQGYVEDAEVLKATQPYLTKAGDLLVQPIGKALVDLDGKRENVRSQETNLGNLVTDAMRAKVDAEVGFMNGGGIRATIPAGIISYRDVLTVLPFGNTISVVTMTGEQIMQVLDMAVAVKPGAGAFLHVSGLKWTLNRTTGKAENVMVGDAQLDPQKTYKAVTNNFMATGGDGYVPFTALPQYDSGFVLADALMEYIKNAGNVEPKVDGRLTIVE